MVEGHLLLGSDWLIVVQSLAPSYITAQCTSTSYLQNLLMCLGLRNGPLSRYHHYHIVLCFIVPLAWYSVSHDGLILLTDLWPCLLMFQGLL